MDSDGFSDLLVGAFLSDRVTLINSNENCSDNIDNDMDSFIDFDDSDCLIQDQGTAYLYFGNSPFRPTKVVTSTDVTFLGEAKPGVTPSFIPESGQFGFSLAEAGDINGNGSDLIIGAYLHDTGIRGTEIDLGKAYIFFGGPLFPTASSILATKADQTVTGSEGPPLGPDNGFGISVQ